MSQLLFSWPTTGRLIVLIIALLSIILLSPIASLAGNSCTFEATMTYVPGLMFIAIAFILSMMLTGFSGSSGDKFDTGFAFPEAGTRLCAFIIAILGIFCLAGLFIMLLGPGWKTGLLKNFSEDKVRSMQEAFVMMFAGGIGASIRTMLAYVRHASNQKDFSIAWIPWYVIRPINGMLLGLIFYFLLNGGLLMVIQPEDSIKIDSFNIWSLAAIGSIVGLFSREALDKLRKVFNNIFQTDEQESNGGKMPPPGTTPPPGATVIPGTTPPPGTTVAPGTTSPPGTTVAPGTTPPPGTTVAPGTTLPPGTTVIPGTTLPPGTTAPPGTTSSPDTKKDKPKGP